MVWIFILSWLWVSAAAASAVEFYINGEWKTRVELNVGLFFMLIFGPMLLPFFLFLVFLNYSSRSLKG